MTVENGVNPAHEVRSSVRPALPVFIAAIFLSAMLLFAVQPMFTKMVLPKFGGAPSVWSVALVFFQAMLLAGYIYAHILTRMLPVRIALALHLGLLAVAAMTLPLAIASGWTHPPGQGEAFWLLGLFAMSIGLPFFALSANGPLLQAWFARTDHPAAKDPYFLYAASNVGSFVALLSYPFVVEPFLRLGDQSKIWSAGFYALIALIGLCGLFVVRTQGAAIIAAGIAIADRAPPTWRNTATWVVLAAIPSALLVAVTAHLSTDIAAAPLLWVVPLALYLATFVVVFQTRPAIPHYWAVRLQPVMICLLFAVHVFEDHVSIFTVMAVNLLAFFFTALVCHGELVRRRPAPAHLTSFYMWMSAGGMVGGISAAMVAPALFNWVAEYPLLIVAALLCRPGLRLPEGRLAKLSWLLTIFGAFVVLGLVQKHGLGSTAFTVTVLGLLVVSALVWSNPLRFAALVAFLFTFVHVQDGSQRDRQEILRSFFGVHKIVETNNGQFRTLLHGTTIHGAQRIRDADGNPIDGAPEPLTYFSERSPMAQAVIAARDQVAGPASVAIVGLGVGTLACYTRSDDRVDVYEIDPLVVRIATDPARFTFMSQCAPKARIVLGDARLTLEAAPDAIYDLIVMDAFTSDAVPVHLITREAMVIYVSKLKPDGMVVMHVMNRHLELASVAAGVAQANGLRTRVMHADDIEDPDNFIYASSVAAMARSEAAFGRLAEMPHWQIQKPDPRQWVWTDDYSNILGAMIRYARQH